MKKRILSLAMAACLALSMMLTPVCLRQKKNLEEISTPTPCRSLSPLPLSST